MSNVGAIATSAPECKSDPAKSLDAALHLARSRSQERSRRWVLAPRDDRVGFSCHVSVL